MGLPAHGHAHRAQQLRNVLVPLGRHPPGRLGAGNAAKGIRRQPGKQPHIDLPLPHASGGPCQAVRQMVPHFTRRPENRLSAGHPGGRIPAAVQRLFKQEIRLQERMLDQQAVQGRLVRVAPVRLVHQRYMARQLPVRLRLQPLVRPVLHGRPQALADARGLAVQ